MLRVRDIMTTDVLSVSPETSVREAMELLTRHHISGAPVLAGGTIVGVVTATDLMMLASSLSGVPTEQDLTESWCDSGDTLGDDGADAERDSSSAYFAELWEDAGAETHERIAHINGPEWNALEEHDVSEVMTRAPLITLRPDAEVAAAAGIMSRHGIHRLLVTEDGHLVGIISSLDIATAAATHQLSANIYVFNRDQDFRM